MAEKDFSKLRKFVEAATTNPAHPVYALGMRGAPALQHYATNVQLLKAVEAEQWFKDYPQYTEQLEKVMAICEEQAMPAAAPAAQAAGGDEAAALKAENETLKARIAELEKPAEGK